MATKHIWMPIIALDKKISKQEAFILKKDA